MDRKKQRNISRLIKFLLFFLLFITNSTSIAKEFKSKYNFKFNLPEGYQIINNLNLFDVYNTSHKDPLIKQQINLFKKRLEQQDIELLYNFSQSPFNNISILVFNNDYEVNKKNVIKQCKKILKIGRKLSKRKVDLIECRMHNQPSFANWSMYRENESSFFENEMTQQIIFLYKKKEYVITVACAHRCDLMKDDLFKLVETIKF
tara:strand:+ start:398 stop:1009 length:612 start_codon:yes stop_codon:yes gene_type:complete